jgi:DNA-binding winged helix-turn-helix (wHTH) protein
MSRIVNPLKPPLQYRDRVLEFAQYRLDVGRRSLTTGQRRVYVTSRALAILIALAERAGEVVSKRELHALIWPNEVVEEGTLRVHVAALRKALGEKHKGHQLVQNVHGRGYRLAVTVTDSSAAAAALPVSASTDLASPAVTLFLQRAATRMPAPSGRSGSLRLTQACTALRIRWRRNRAV